MSNPDEEDKFILKIDYPNGGKTIQADLDYDELMLEGLKALFKGSKPMKLYIERQKSD